MLSSSVCLHHARAPYTSYALTLSLCARADRSAVPCDAVTDEETRYVEKARELCWIESRKWWCGLSRRNDDDFEKNVMYPIVTKKFMKQAWREDPQKGGLRVSFLRHRVGGSKHFKGEDAVTAKHHLMYRCVVLAPIPRI